MAAMHDASGSYYGGSVSTGHPSNAYGWAIGGAVAINLPTWGATSNVNSQPNVDQFQMQGVFSRGALGYATNAVGPSLVANGNTAAALQWGVDGMYSSGAGVELTSAWSVYGGYQHLWTPNWRTSLYGGYLAVSYDSAATAMACTNPNPGIGGVNMFGFLASGALSGSCLNYHTWQVGTRTQWNPVSQLDVGVDVLYSRVGTALDGSVFNATGLAPTFATAGKVGGMTVADQDVWSVMFRVQRNFWP
jgi:hypothetical protein